MTKWERNNLAFIGLINASFSSVFFFLNACDLKNIIELETQLPFKMGPLMFNLQYLCGELVN